MCGRRAQSSLCRNDRQRMSSGVRLNQTSTTDQKTLVTVVAFYRFQVHVREELQSDR